MNRMEKILIDVRAQRDKDLSHKKLKEIQLLKTGRLNHTANDFGFGGAAATGGQGGAGYQTQQAGQQSQSGTGMGGTQRFG